MKIFVRNYNGILDGFQDMTQKSGEYTNNHHESDCLVTWQDVRGDHKELAEIYQNRLDRPVVVVEHGRGATRDYCEPNKFPLLADKICVWGNKSRERLLKQGIDEDRIRVVGCPLLKRLKKRTTNRTGLNILFTPVISTKEEPENVLVYAMLKKWESQKLIEQIYTNFSAFKNGWATKEHIYKDFKKEDGTVESRLWSDDIVPRIPRSETYKKGFVHAKLTGIHDSAQYLVPIIGTNQGDLNHIQTVIDLLKDIDIVVCLEEGTLQLLATAMNIPVILCDIFKYENYGGMAHYDRVEKIKTPAVYSCDLGKLPSTLDYAIQNMNEKLSQRIQVINEEAGGDIALTADENIYRVVQEAINSKKSPISA